MQYRATLAVEIQEEIRKDLVQTARNTVFGRDHQFDEISTYADFRRSVPIGDYEAFKPYADRIKAGEARRQLARRTEVPGQDQRDHQRGEVHSPHPREPA